MSAMIKLLIKPNMFTATCTTYFKGMEYLNVYISFTYKYIITNKSWKMLAASKTA